MEIWDLHREDRMADYKEKFDEWQQAARRKARELDEKYAISDIVGEGARAAGEAAKRGAETMASGAERIRAEAEKLSDEEEVGETARRAASETVKNVKKAGKVVKDVAGDTGKRVFDDAKTYYDRASHLYNTGASVVEVRSSVVVSLRVVKHSLTRVAGNVFNDLPGLLHVLDCFRGSSSRGLANLFFVAELFGFGANSFSATGHRLSAA